MVSFCNLENERDKEWRGESLGDGEGRTIGLGPTQTDGTGRSQGTPICLLSPLGAQNEV